MGRFKRFAVVLDAYGPLWLAIVAVVVTCYLWGPCIKAVEQHDEDQRQEQAEQEQAEIERTVEYLERLKSQNPAARYVQR